MDVDRVLLAEPRGFCAGVEMAIKALAWMVRAFEPPVYCYHEIVHNQLVVDRFRDLGDRLDAAHRCGGDGHRADGLFVSLVADIDDAVSLAGSHLDLVVDLGDERAHRIDDVTAAGACCGDHLRR